MGADRVAEESAGGGGSVRAMQDAAELQAHFAEFGQSHVFRFWDQLDDAGRTRLRLQASGIDLASLARIQANLAAAAGAVPSELEPIEAERLPELSLDALLKPLTGEDITLVALDGIEDPQNLGAIARVASP